MKETGILFTPENIRAICEGRKSQTRRVIDPQPVWDAEVKFTRNCGPFAFPIGSLDQQCGFPIFTDGRKDGSFGIRNLYGGVGDRLYIKEGIIRHVSIPQLIGYYMDGCRVTEHWEKRSTARFMPKWAARTWLELTDVRVERLHDISEEDAIAEGIQRQALPDLKGNHFHWGDKTKDRCKTAVEAYRGLWDSINAKKHPWKNNDWVWALTFCKQ